MAGLFKSLKDAKRRAVESVLASVGASEETVDEEFNVHHKKFEAMMADLNECGATLDMALDRQQASFEGLSDLAAVMERVYRKNVEISDWPNVRCNLSNLSSALAFRERMVDINTAIRTSAQKVTKDNALIPIHQNITKVAPEIDAAVQDRTTKLKDFDSYRRRLKKLESNRESLESQGKANTSSHNETMSEIARFEAKKETADSLYTEQNEKVKEDIIKAKKAHDYLLEQLIICVITCQAELMAQASEKLKEVVSMLPVNKVSQYRARMHDFIIQGGVKLIKLELTQTEKALAIASGKALPSDFVKTKEDIEKEQLEREREMERARSLVKSNSNYNPFDDTLPSPPPSAQPGGAKGGGVSKNPRVKALYDHEPDQDDELPFRVDDIIEILETGEDGWWKGRCNGKEGMFPVNYVEHL